MDEFLIKELEFDLTSSDLGTRRHALISLSNMSRTPLIFSIFKRVMTEDEHPEIQYLARKFFNEWRPAFEAQEPTEQPQVFTKGEIDAGQVKQSFVSQNRQIKLEVAKQIIERQDKRALPLVVDALEKEKDPFVISALVKAVGAVGDANQITLMQGFLKHEDSRVRANTVEGLDMIGDDLCFPILVPMLQDPDNRVKGNTIKALMGFDEGAAKDLIVKLSKSTKEGRRASACFCLHLADADWVEEILLEMVKKEETLDLLKTECEMLAEHGSIESVGWLAMSLETAGREKGLCYKFALDALTQKYALEPSRVQELSKQARKAIEPTSPPKNVDFEQSRWDMDAIKDILPKKGKRRGRRLRDKKKRDGGEKAPAVSASAGGFQWPEGSRYLIPAGIGVLIVVIVGISALFGPGRGSTKPTEQPVVAGKKVSLTCRVRFIDRRKSTMTLAHGHRYYLGKFPKGTDLSHIKVRDIVTIKGTQTTQRHFDAVVVNCTSVEKAKASQ